MMRTMQDPSKYQQKYLYFAVFASGMTVAIAIVTALVFKAKRPERAAAALLVFAALLVGWFAVACIRLVVALT